MSTVNQEKKGSFQDTGNQERKTPSQDPGFKRPNTGNPNMPTTPAAAVETEWNQVADKAKDLATTAGECASHTAAAVGTMASQAVSDAGKMASQAACDVTKMASQAASDVTKMASQAASDVGRRADDLTASAGAGIEGFGETIRRNTPQSGVFGTASQAVANTVKESGHYLEEHKLSGMAEDIALVIKRNPIPAVCIALGIGWFAGRALRG